ncbi:hypothetical protein D7S89_13275 [Trinickia fusca]|uniref:Uncharacterized protein n=2 Tax=Trinickia fusca TaxID=2419777 RepID=A0A494XJI9_9BURK|nr:hypothetical protein D7S89_13275 [Trinickia fusca]
MRPILKAPLSGMLALGGKDSRPYLGQLNMKHRQIAATTACIFLAILTTGCATVTGGTTQNVSVKTQKNAADVAGADCTLSNSRGSWTVATPGTVSVHRAKDDLNIHCSKDGERDIIMAVKSRTRTGTIVGNVVLLGVGALVLDGVDKANGSAYAYPETITASFVNGDELPGIPGDASTGSINGTPAQAAATPAINTASSLTR